MALILAAPLLTVARLILSKGVRQASKKYGPKLIKKTKDYISKNKLIWDGKKIIKPKAGSIKNVRKTNKKTTTKKDSFDEALKKKEGAKNFNKANKDATKNKAPTAYVDKFGNAHTTAAGADRANKLTRNPRIKLNKKKTTKKTTTKKTNDTKTVSNVNKPPTVAPNLKKAAKVGAGLVLGGLAIDQASKVLSNMSKSKGSEPSTFGAAFRKARKEKGPNATFTYKGKQYSTVTLDEVKKAGFETLGEYLNAKKKKSGTTKPGTK